MARGEESLLAILPGGRHLEAKVAYIDEDLDIALAKVGPPGPGGEFPHLALADVKTVRQGESVIAIGNPGNTGGPLINSRGEVIGINRNFRVAPTGNAPSKSSNQARSLCAQRLIVLPENNSDFFKFSRGLAKKNRASPRRPANKLNEENGNF